MHEFDAGQLSNEQRRWAERANAIQARLDALLVAVVTADEPLLQTLKADAELHGLAADLLHANLQLWMTTSAQARRVLVCADHVVRHLAEPFSPRSLGAVVINARYASQSLLAMTDAQRRALLSIPAVAQAYDIALDCEAEFENREQWRKWVKRAHSQRTSPAVPGANDNGPVEVRDVTR